MLAEYYLPSYYPITLKHKNQKEYFSSQNVDITHQSQKQYKSLTNNSTN